jgi:hypothetical protein
MDTEKSQKILCRIWDLWQIEIAIKHGIDDIIKNTKVIALHQEYVLVIFIIQYNSRLCEFLPFYFYDLRWWRQSMEPRVIVGQVLGTLNIT